MEDFEKNVGRDIPSAPLPEYREESVYTSDTYSLPHTADTYSLPRTAVPSAAARRPGRRVKKKKHRWRGFAAFMAGVAVTAALAAAAQRWQTRVLWRPDEFSWEYRDDQQDESWDGTTGIFLPTAAADETVSFTVLREHGETRPAPEVYRTVNPSVLTVVVELEGRGSALGTGVLFTEDGYFLTNYHVVDGGRECIAVTEDGRRFPALYVAGDEDRDLAILKMELQEENTLPAAEFGDSDLLSVGDKVYAIGNPLGVEFRGTFTDGIVSAIDREVTVEGRTMTLIQTNAALNVGNSGGPLINEYGQVVGINVVKMSSSRSTVEGLGFAIPSSTMSRLVNDLLMYGYSRPEPVIGVMVYSYTEKTPDGQDGIYIESVDPDTPAETAGMLAGDYILAVNGTPVLSSRDILRARRQCYPGDSIVFTIWRDGAEFDLSIVFPVE